MFLQKISYFIIGIALSFTQVIGQNTNYNLTKNNIFLTKYVQNDLVNYASIKLNVKELNELLINLDNLNLGNGNYKKALLINQYNLYVIKQLVDNYPTQSPQKITDFFTKKFIAKGKNKISLNDVENQIRDEYKDPRIHFVLVCGALGCPPITQFAYDGNNLENQLNQQTKLALNNPAFIKVNPEKKQVLLSEIFKWYEKDFIINHKNVIGFINKYREKPLNTSYSTDYYTYNWGINSISLENKTQQADNIDNSQKLNKLNSTQDYTPSLLYAKGQWEYKFFNNLYSQTKGFTSDGNKENLSNRSSYLTSINQLTVGVTSRFSIGLDFWVKSVRIDDLTSSPINLLSFSGGEKSRTALTNLGLKVKVQPFKNIKQLSIQSVLLFPIAPDQQGLNNNKPYLSEDSYLSITQIFYDQTITKKLQLFLQIAPWIYMKKKAVNGNRFNISTPADVFLSYFATDRITFYIQQGYWPNFGSNGINSWFRQEGLGAKYQILKGKLETETSYTRFSMGANTGAGATYNLGLRYISL